MNNYTPTRSGNLIRLVAALTDPPPWQPRHNGGQTNRGLQAAYRRWKPAPGNPGIDLLAPLWKRFDQLETLRSQNGWPPLADPSWPDDQLEALVAQSAILLHLIAQLPDESRSVDNFGTACKAAGFSDGRFARLVNAPHDPVRRIEALTRAFKRFRAQPLRLQLIRRDEDGRRQYDELQALYQFLFTPYTQKAVSHWAKGFYRHTAATSPETQTI